MPFIFVSRTLGEEDAIEAHQLGATDYVSKTRLSRIIPSVRRAMRESKERVQRQLAEQTLRESEAYLAEAQRLSHTGSFRWKLDSGEINWSDETYRIFEDDPGVKPRIDLLVQRVHPEDRPDFLKVIESASAGATQFEHTYRWLLPDGSVKHVHAVAHALQDATGNREFVGAATDITERKAAEEARGVLSRDLQESKAKLEEAQRITHVGYWEWDILTGRVNWSDETYRIYGMQPQERPMDIAACQEKIYPEDWQRGMELALGGGTRFNAECRVIRPNGEVRIAHFQGDVKRDASGQPYHMNPAHSDPQKAAERAF